MKVKRNKLKWLPVLLGILVSTGCEKEIEVDLPDAPEKYVVEAYVNQLNPLLNYVMLTKTLDYFNPSFNPPFVSGAGVFMIEGRVQGSDTIWDNNRKYQFLEPMPDTLPGIYINPLMQPKAGAVYKLEIEVNGVYIDGITTIPKPVPLDSLSFEFHLNPSDTFAYMRAHFFEPPERGNSYRMMYLLGPDSSFFTWGDVIDSDIMRTDEHFNGRPYEVFYNRPVRPGDTVNYYLISMDRNSYRFWDSYESLKGSTGNPFATPVQLESNINNAIGSFTGYGVHFTRKIVPIP